MTKQQVAAEIKHIEKLFGKPMKDRYQRNSFQLVKTKSARNYNEFKVDQVEKNNRRYK